MNTSTIAAILALGLLAGSAQAAPSSIFEITVQAEGAGAEVVKVDLAPKGTVRKTIGNLFLDISAPHEENGTGRSELRLLSQQKDGSFKILHIAGIATFPDEVVKASYGMCRGRVVFQNDMPVGAPVCQ